MSAAYGAFSGIALLFAVAVWIIAIAIMVLTIKFLINVPKTLEGIEKQLQISNSLKAEQMHQEALKDADPFESFSM